MRQKICLLFTVAFFCLSLTSKGALTPLAIEIVPPIQFPPWDFTVAGLRLSALVGSNRYFYGFDFGTIGNITNQEFGGMAVSGIFNVSQGITTVFPFQIAGITNVNEGVTHAIGLQIAGILNYGTKANYVGGIQLAPVNITPFTKIMGLQLGLFNQAGDVYGFQIGVFNFTERLHGFQLGLLNFNKSGLFSVCPVINFGM